MVNYRLLKNAHPRFRGDGVCMLRCMIRQAHHGSFRAGPEPVEGRLASKHPVSSTGQAFKQSVKKCFFSTP